jgi:hypothetical protein
VAGLTLEVIHVKPEDCGQNRETTNSYELPGERHIQIRATIGQWLHLGRWRGGYQYCDVGSILLSDVIAYGTDGRWQAKLGGIGNDLTKMHLEGNELAATQPDLIPSGSLPDGSLREESMIIGPISLGKMFQDEHFSMLPAQTTGLFAPMVIDSIIAELEPVEVYIIDKKYVTGNVVSFFPEADGYPKIVMTQGFVPSAHVPGLTVQAIHVKPIDSRQNDGRPVTVERPGERRFQIQMTVQSACNYLGFRGRDDDYFEGVELLSDILFYGLDGKCQTSPSRCAFDPFRIDPEERDLSPQVFRFFSVGFH